MSASALVVGILNIFAALLVIGLSIPLVRRRVKRNGLYGIRIKKSFESDELWYEINAFGGREMIKWSVMLLIIGVGSLFMPLDDIGNLVLVPALASLLLVIPCWTTYQYAKTL